MENYKAHSRYIIETILNDAKVPWERESRRRYLEVGGRSINLFGYIGLCTHILTGCSLSYKLNRVREVLVNNSDNAVVLGILEELNKIDTEINFKGMV